MVCCISSLQTLLLHDFKPSFIIAMLKLHSVIDFLVAVVSYATALPLIKIGVLQNAHNYVIYKATLKICEIIGARTNLEKWTLKY